MRQLFIVPPFELEFRQEFCLSTVSSLTIGLKRIFDLLAPLAGLVRSALALGVRMQLSQNHYFW